MIKMYDLHTPFKKEKCEEFLCYGWDINFWFPVTDCVYKFNNLLNFLNKNWIVVIKGREMV